jgi:hypothetical protein
MSNDNNFFQLWDDLHGDVRQALDDVRTDDSQYNRRTLVRAIFAAIEGMVFMLKDNALGSADKSPDLYTVAELAMLRDEAYTLKDNGSASIRKYYPPTDANLRFALTMYARGIGVKSSFDPSGKGWSDFLDAIAVRNRVTHPKASTEYMISDSELVTARDTYFWFMRVVMTDLFSAIPAFQSLLRQVQTLAGKAQESAQTEPPAEAQPGT